MAITASGDIDGLKLSQWFRGLLAEFGERMMRMKAFSICAETRSVCFPGRASAFRRAAWPSVGGR